MKELDCFRHIQTTTTTTDDDMSESVLDKRLLIDPAEEQLCHQITFVQRTEQFKNKHTRKPFVRAPGRALNAAQIHQEECQPRSNGAR